MFVQSLNALTAGTSGAQRTITSNAWFCIKVWRAVACILAASPAALAIPLRELVPPAGSTPAFALVTDAGPVAVGIAIFRVDTIDDDPANPERCIAFCHLDLASWNEALTKEPTYQNTREFCGALLGLILTHDLQVAGVLPQGPINLHWHGDSQHVRTVVD